MAKSLLILLLVTTQLLAGIGGSLYLCISNDGDRCCIDSGPAFCTCGHEDKHEGCVDAGCCDDVESCHENHHRDQTREPGQLLLAGDPCGCTHVLLSADNPTVISRNTGIEDSQRIIQWVAVLPRSDTWNETLQISIPDIPPNRPPWISDLNLIVISTVVIRC